MKSSIVFILTVLALVLGIDHFVQNSRAMGREFMECEFRGVQGQMSFVLQPATRNYLDEFERSLDFSTSDGKLTFKVIFSGSTEEAKVRMQLHRTGQDILDTSEETLNPTREFSRRVAIPKQGRTSKSTQIRDFHGQVVSVDAIEAVCTGFEG